MYQSPLGSTPVNGVEVPFAEEFVMSPEEEKIAIFRSIKYLSDEVQRIDKERVEPTEVATATVDELMKRIQDEATVENVVNVWSGVLDKHLGKFLRKVLWTLFILFCGTIALKYDWPERVMRLVG